MKTLENSRTRNSFSTASAKVFVAQFSTYVNLPPCFHGRYNCAFRLNRVILSLVVIMLTPMQAEREWRRKEAEEIQRHVETEAMLKQARAQQMAQREHLLAVEAQRERADFERVLR